MGCRFLLQGFTTLSLFNGTHFPLLLDLCFFLLHPGSETKLCILLETFTNDKILVAGHFLTSQSAEVGKDGSLLLVLSMWQKRNGC